MITHDFDHIQEGLARLIQQYQDSPLFKTWIAIYLKQIQAIEDAFWEVLEKRNIDSGIGVQLDSIGAILNRPRGGLGDDDYRIALRAEIAILRSTGTADDMFTVGDLSIPLGYSFTLTDEGNAALLVQIEEQVTFSATTFFENLQRAKQGGVKLLFEFSTNTPGTDFTWADGPGWDDNISGVGGLLAAVLTGAPDATRPRAQGRPLGQFPDWADHTTSTISAPAVGFTPNTEDAGAANFAVRQQFRDWLYRDALEVLNWGPSNKLVSGPGILAAGPDCFSYDPVRRVWFFGGLSNADNSIGVLNYSFDGWQWLTVSSGVLPHHHASDTTAFYQQAVSDDGRYLTWLSSGVSLIAQYAYLNSNAGFAGWTASVNQPGHIIGCAYWAEPDNRFIVTGLTGGALPVAWSVDVDTDTWDVLALVGGTMGLVPNFGAGSPGDRLVANASQLWRTSSVASAFAQVAVPWTNLLNLVWLPGSFVFLAITPNAIYASPNGVVWAQVTTGFEGQGAWYGPACGLGDACVVAFHKTNPDGVTSNLLLVGTNALRDWFSTQAPASADVFDIIQTGDSLAMVNTATSVASRRSVGVL